MSEATSGRLFVMYEGGIMLLLSLRSSRRSLLAPPHLQASTGTASSGAFFPPPTVPSLSVTKLTPSLSLPSSSSLESYSEPSPASSSSSKSSSEGPWSGGLYSSASSGSTEKFDCSYLESELIVGVQKSV